MTNQANTKNFRLNGYEYIRTLDGGLARRRITLDEGSTDFGKATIDKQQVTVMYDYNKRAWVQVEEWEAQASQVQEIKTQYKVSIDMNKVAEQDVQALHAALTPDLAEPMFQGFRFLMARYNNADTACARALDAESAAYCGHAEVEEVQA